MKPYPAYKDSGIEWIGEIPEHWDITKLKYIVLLNQRVLNENTPEDYEFQYLDISCIENGFIVSKPQQIYFGNAPSRARRIVKKEDILVSTVRTYLKAIAHISDDEKNLIASTGFAVITPSKKIHSKYLYYILSSQKIIDTISSLSVGVSYPAINSAELISIPIWYSKSFSEQQSIVEFLDKKTSQIDTIIEKKQKQIELLKEERTAIINQAVTKGLNPDVPMKDSGIEWLGEVPEHWNTAPLRHVSYMKGRIGWQGLKQSEFRDEGPYLITGMNFRGGEIDWNECYHISEERYNEAPEIHVKEEDVLMTKDGTIGKLLYATDLPGPTSLNSHLLLLRPFNNSYVPKYLYYLLHSDYFQGHIENYKTGTTFYGITQEAMGLFKTLIFDKKEQSEIVLFLDKELEKINLIIHKIQNQITFLQEYRTALISNSVTGKIDVRDEVGLLE